MSGILKTVFGGSDTKSTSTPTDVVPQELQELRGPFADLLKGLLGGGRGDPIGGIPQAEGPLAAPLGAGESDILRVLQEGIGGDRSEFLSNTLRGDFLPGSAGSNPFLDAAIRAAQRPTLEGLTETLDRTLPGRFTQAGQFVQPRGSSAFDRAAAIATRGAGDALAGIATNISAANFEAERGRQQQAVQLGQAEVQSTIQNLQAQALPRLIQDLGIERGLQQFQLRLQTLIQALGATTAAPLVSNAQTTQSNTNQQTGVVPGIANLVGAFGNLPQGGG